MGVSCSGTHLGEPEAMLRAQARDALVIDLKTGANVYRLCRVPGRGERVSRRPAKDVLEAERARRERAGAHSEQDLANLDLLIGAGPAENGEGHAVSNQSIAISGGLDIDY
jgi:hypothetical protein